MIKATTFVALYHLRVTLVIGSVRMKVDMSNMRKIVVVEDDPAVAEILRDALEGAGYQVSMAPTGSEGLMLIRDLQPDVVLTDQDMPEQTGLEMLRELRSQQNYVAVLFVSARGDVEMVTQALRAGADDYIRKPFRVEEMLARIEACLRTRDLHQQLLVANQQLQQTVERDYLTGLFNMRSMYERIDGEIKRAARFGRELAAIMVDMDHFKRVNDEHDHLFGSFVLKETGRLITETMRDSDFAARYGGDEFLIVLTDVHLEGARAFCERLRARVKKHLFEDGKDQIQLTISMGGAITQAKNIDARALVRRADEQLYKAKEKGRDRFELVSV